MKIHLHLCFIFMFGSFALQRDSKFPVPDYSTSLSRAVLIVIREFFEKRAIHINFSRASSNSEGYRAESDLINEILYHAKFQLSYVMEGYFHLFMKQPRFFNIFFIDSYISFTYLRDNMSQDSFNYRGYYYIVFVGSPRDYYEQIGWIFSDCWDRYITNVNVIINVGFETLVYSYFPFTRFHCNGWAAIVVNKFKNSTFEFAHSIFIDKDQNLFECEIPVATWQSPPFVMFKTNDNRIELSGFEGRILENLAERMNFTIKLIIPEENDRTGQIFPNGTITGAMGMVKYDEAHMTINGYAFTNARVQHMTASYSYVYLPLIIALPAGADYTPFEKLFLPFGHRIWILIGTYLLAGYCFLHILKIGKLTGCRRFVVGAKNNTPFLNAFNVLLGGPIEHLPTRNFARTLLAIWMYYSFILRNSYQGLLFYYLQDYRKKMPEWEISKLLDRDFTFYAGSTEFEFMSYYPAIQRHMKLIQGPLNNYFEELYDESKNFGVFAMQPQITYFNSKNRHRGVIFVTPYRFMLLPICIYLRKQSFLLEKIDRELQNYMSSGLISYWLKNYTGVEPAFEKGYHYRDPQPLKWSHLEGGFQFCLGIISASLFVFFLEILSRKSQIIRRIMNYIQY